MFTSDGRILSWREQPAVWRAMELPLRGLHLGLSFPSVLYLVTLVVFLFRPPDLDFYHADRVALGVLVFLVTLRLLADHGTIPFRMGVSLPLLGLASLAASRALREPFDPQTWSLVASKFVVPLVLFHLSMVVFRDASSLRHFRVFVMLALGYLILTAIAFFVDAHSLIFPAFILDG